MTASSATLLGYIFGSSSYNNAVPVEQSFTANNSQTYYLPKNLERVTVKGGTTLFYGAFSGITSLKELSLPNTLTKIEANILAGDSELELIWFRGTETVWTNTVIKDTNWNHGCGSYKLEYVPGNLVRVTVLGAEGSKMRASEATLKNGAGETVYTGFGAYFGAAFINVENGTYTLPSRVANTRKNWRSWSTAMRTSRSILLKWISSNVFMTAR